MGPCKISKFIKKYNVSIQDIILFFQKYPNDSPKNYRLNTRLSNLQVSMLEDGIVRYKVVLGVENLDFYDSYYQIKVFCDGERGVKIKPLIIRDQNSARIFNYVKAYFKKKLPSDIVITYSPNRVLKIDHQLALDSFVKTIKDGIDFSDEWSGLRNLDKLKTLPDYRSESKSKVEYAVSLKNVFIDYLVGLQSSMKLIRTHEIFNSEKEDCFMFSISMERNRVGIVFENVNYARASHVFICDNGNYENAVSKIYSYFTSESLKNKRLLLHKANVNPELFCSNQHFVIHHNSFEYWSTKLNSVLGIRTESKSEIIFVPGLKMTTSCDLKVVKNINVHPENKHELIKKSLYSDLVADYGFENVGCELKVGNNKIDVCVKKNENFDIYEIKTCSSARACVREAMGQILEYAFF